MSSKDLTSSGLFEYLDMGYMEGINYVLFKNPVSATVIGSVKDLANATVFRQPSTTTSVKLPPALENLPVSRLVLSGNPFVRLAGLSGAAAVILGAYGAHSFYVKEGYEDQKRVYQIAHTYHFINSLALLGVPLCRFPKTAGTLITLGILLFSGSCYYDAFTAKTQLRKFTPIGGTLLICGWLCFAL